MPEADLSGAWIAVSYSKVSFFAHGRLDVGSDDTIVRDLTKSEVLQADDDYYAVLRDLGKSRRVWIDFWELLYHLSSPRSVGTDRDLQNFAVLVLWLGNAG
jgi:hypothetical protein